MDNFLIMIEDHRKNFDKKNALFHANSKIFQDDQLNHFVNVMGDLSLETLTLIINKDPRVLYLATLNNGKYCLAIFEKIQTVIQVNPSRLNIIMNNIKKPLMAFAECKERGVAELSMELIGELIKKIFSSKSESCENIGRDLL